ncbi:hypothetical protein HIM_05890 [Hirsutella minnesotensis 3608]|uniref:ER-bound oxygenase mpaB/mpaB'/Rubber oxygenase catalytic domain-containing protein n=1 Tax=Hirsutella minnesotensis 3608 TaxID=1043627 RepID=A0A0F7ZUF5_9HYPO|nr:hypothetical protein HIM_05890 [Hirsutella minnesotensis 3608]
MDPVNEEADQAIVPAVKRRYKTPVIYETIEEPTFLRELIEDDIYLFGGHFAILCQFAHPALAEGTRAHSSFAGRAAIFSVIHGQHARVRGAGYDANDPELHRWTAATLFVSLLVVHETFFGPLAPDRLLALYRQSAVFGTSLRMPPDMWPATLADFWAYWEANYGIEPTPLSRLGYGATVSVVRVLYPLLPAAARQRWHRQYMEDLNKAVANIERTGHWVEVKKRE